MTVYDNTLCYVIVLICGLWHCCSVPWRYVDVFHQKVPGWYYSVYHKCTCGAHVFTCEKVSRSKKKWRPVQIPQRWFSVKSPNSTEISLCSFPQDWLEACGELKQEDVLDISVWQWCNKSDDSLCNYCSLCCVTYITKYDANTYERINHAIRGPPKGLFLKCMTYKRPLDVLVVSPYDGLFPFWLFLVLILGSKKK